MEVHPGMRVYLQKETPGEVITAVSATKTQKPMELHPAGTKFQFFRKFEKGGKMVYVFHTGGRYIGRRYIQTTDPDAIFGLEPLPEPATAEE
jgi:hypothetical protein